MSYIIDEGADLLWICRPWPVRWSRCAVLFWSHIITEHVRTVVKAPVQNAQVKVLLKSNCHSKIRPLV